jgi:hypothetical protein
MRLSGWKSVGIMALSLLVLCGQASATATMICRDDTHSVGYLTIDSDTATFRGPNGGETYVNGRVRANQYHAENTCTEFVQISAQRYEFGLRCKNETTDLVSPAVRWRLDRYTGYLAQLTPTVQGLGESDHAQCERASSGPQL